MITFYPGPSKVYPQVAQYMQEAFETGVLSLNHRSAAFSEILAQTLGDFRTKLAIPSNYSIYLVSSATEAWEIVAQSLTQHHSLHFYNGAFGKKWFHFAANIVPNASATWFDPRERLSDWLFARETHITDHNLSALAKAEVVCLTHNETSNGTQLFDMAQIRSRTSALMAIDVTSSMGGVLLDWTLGDVWLASVQKCLGLPAGLGVMVCSPRAVARAQIINDRLRYNSFLHIHDNFQQYQTHYTPNVLGVFLLGKIMQQVPHIEETNKKTMVRSAAWYDLIDQHVFWKNLVQNLAVRSQTVVAVEGTKMQIDNIKQEAIKHNITLGNGYGEWKPTTFRIANFPQIDDAEIETLRQFLVTPP